MKYYLKPIEQFVSIYLNHKDTFIERVDDGILLKSIFNILNAQFETIKYEISQSYYSFDEERVSTHFIQKHQRKLVFLANQISFDMAQENGSASNSKKMIQGFTISKLNNLLKYIEDEYKHCLDNSYYITTEYAREKAREYSDFLAGLSSPFYYCDSLMKIAREPIETFIDSKKTTYNHSKIKYLDRLVKELQRVQKISEYSFKTNLINTLININFNNANFFYYLTNMIHEQVKSKDTSASKILVLRLNLKQYRQKIIKNNIAFLNHRHNIKDQVISWINDELEFTERSQQYPDKAKTKLLSSPTDERINLDLSVDQFAVLMRIAIEKRIITNDEFKPVLNILSKVISTKKAPSPSVGNLWNGAYRYELNDIGDIKSNLKKWLNSLM